MRNLKVVPSQDFTLNSDQSQLSTECMGAKLPYILGNKMKTIARLCFGMIAGDANGKLCILVCALARN